MKNSVVFYLVRFNVIEVSMYDLQDPMWYCLRCLRYEKIEIFCTFCGASLPIFWHKYKPVNVTIAVSPPSRYGYQAIEDLTKALEFEPDTADILHERGSLPLTNLLFVQLIFAGLE